MAVDIILFMMIICHQQYDQINKIPLSVLMQFPKRFSEIVSKLFQGNNGININIHGNQWIPDLTPPWEKQQTESECKFG